MVPSSGSSASRSSKSVPTRPTIGTSAHRSGWNFIRPNSSAVMNDLRPGGGEDVGQFLAAVEVHDRHDHRAEERRRPERHGGLHPVRQLDAPPRRPVRRRARAGLRPAGGPASRRRANVPAIRPDGRVHPEAGVGVGRQSVGDQIAERLRPSTTLRPHSVSSALQGFFALRAAAPPFGRDAILR